MVDMGFKELSVARLLQYRKISDLNQCINLLTEGSDGYAHDWMAKPEDKSGDLCYICGDLKDKHQDIKSQKKVRQMTESAVSI